MRNKTLEFIHNYTNRRRICEIDFAKLEARVLATMSEEDIERCLGNDPNKYPQIKSLLARSVELRNTMPSRSELRQSQQPSSVQDAKSSSA